MKLLDLFCGAGGAAKGYELAGFDEIVGVDIRPQPRYPFTFVLADAFEYLAEHGGEFDAIHASPPCQAYTTMRNLPWLSKREYPALILPTIAMLNGMDRPYVVENVMGAKRGAVGLTKRGLETHGLEAGYLCGWTLGLPMRRHRLFAANWLWLAPPHLKHRREPTTTTDSHPNPVNSGLAQDTRRDRTGHAAEARGSGGAAGQDIDA